jgi:hypothetical protein
MDDKYESYDDGQNNILQEETHSRRCGCHIGPPCISPQFLAENADKAYQAPFGNVNQKRGTRVAVPLIAE